MAPAWVCFECSQPATKQWTIDFMDGTQRLHFYPSIMDWTECYCFAMHSHTHDTHSTRGFPFSLKCCYRKKGRKGKDGELRRSPTRVKYVCTRAKELITFFQIFT